MESPQNVQVYRIWSNFYHFSGTEQIVRTYNIHGELPIQQPLSVNDEGPFPWNGNHTMISVQCFKTGASFPLSIRKQHFDMCYEITITPQQVPAICNLWSPVIKKLQFKVLLSVSMSNGLLEYMCPLFMVERVTWKNVLPQCDLGKMSSLQQHRDLS